MVQENRMLESETLAIFWKLSLHSQRAMYENGEVVTEIAPAF